MMKPYVLSVAYSAVLLSVLGMPAEAAISRDPLIAGARQCTQQFALQEQRHGIPDQLLAAIANTESGRYNKTLQMVLPWPWTINAEGKGYYFDSKAEAIRKVRQLQRQGMKSIDIGCMQVNLKHHPNAFSSIEQAFDPRYNVAYAAKFLRGHYDEMRNWQEAIGAYHSRTPKYGNKYRARVQRSWDAITGKVRMARAALAEDLPRRGPSYRVLKVRDEGSEEMTSLSQPRMIKSRPSSISKAKKREIGRDKRFDLAMREAEGAASAASKAIALRPQDYLSSGFSPKRVQVSPSSNAGNALIIRPKTAVRQPVRAANSAHRDPNSTSSAKFVFVE